MSDDNVKLLRPGTAQPPARRVHPDVLRRSAVQRAVPRNPFTAPSFPPMVEQAVRNAGLPTLAMDDAIASTFGWAGQDAIYSAFAEGTVFLGYSYLATLAQRAEYRVVTETIASEMTREWIELKIASGDESKADKKKRIEDKLDNLNAQHCFRKVAESDGFFGRGHIYLDTGRTNDADELITDLGNGRNQLSKVKIGVRPGQQQLIRLHPVEASWAYPTHYESTDPLQRDWYAPLTWYVMAREIHRSRFITLIGREVPDILKPAYAFGGLSMSQMLKPYVDNWLRTRQSVSDLIQNFSHMVLHTNLDATTSIGGDELFARIALFNNIKTNQGTIVLDKEAEDISNVSVPLGGLDHLQAQCLPAETLILTKRGEVPICEVTPADEVLTRTGWAPLKFAGITGYVDRLVEIETDHGTILRATGWHPIYLPETGEFALAETVKVGQRLLEAPTGPTNTAIRYSGAVAGGAAPRPATTAMSRLVACCIALYGKRMSERFRSALMSTTSMTTAPTTGWAISNSRPAPTTFGITTAIHGASAAISPYTITPASFAARHFRPSIPTPATAARNAIEWLIRLRENLKAMTRPVSSAGQCLLRQPDIRGGTAQPSVPTGLTTVIASRNTVLGAEIPVYNLEVADGYLPEFYANSVLVHNSQEHMAAIARIPLVKLLGIQPAGLNASSEGELESFADWIAAFQNVLFRPALRNIIDLIQLSIWGEVDDDIAFDFKPLRQMKPLEQAQLEATKAQTREIYVQTGAVDANEVREVLAQDPDAPFDGVDLDKPLPMPPGGGMFGGMPGGGGPEEGGPPGLPPLLGGGPSAPGGQSDAMPWYPEGHDGSGYYGLDAAPAFKEEDHPRDHGKFTSGAASSGAAKEPGGAVQASKKVVDQLVEKHGLRPVEVITDKDYGYDYGDRGDKDGIAASAQGNRIIVNHRIWDDPDYWKDFKKKASGIFVGDDPESVIAHEMGHIAWQQMQLPPDLKPRQYKEYAKARDELLRRYFDDQAKVADVSIYAQEHPDEMAAEMFAANHLGRVAGVPSFLPGHEERTQNALAHAQSFWDEAKQLHADALERYIPKPKKAKRA